jgi:molecular chaperone GrpE
MTRKYLSTKESRTEDSMPNDEQTQDEQQSAAPDEASPAVAEDTSQSSGDAAETGDSANEAPGAATSEDQLLERIAELEAEVADLTDQLLRKSADFDNYRKRTLRERESMAAEANRALLLDIVDIIDNFERAIRSADESHDFTAFHDGIVIIEKQFTSMLERKWELTRFDSVGEEFDPQRHEALFTEERADHEHSVVLEDLQKGYLLRDRVLRPAKVKVSMPAPPDES